MSSKLRSLKIKPRLNVSRSQAKLQVISFELCNFSKNFIYDSKIIRKILKRSLKKNPRM